MEIKKITAEDLRRMDGKEGLIIQGCGGDLQEWVDGMNDLLTEAGILKNGTRFEDVSAFQYGELTCLLYPFDNSGSGHWKICYVAVADARKLRRHLVIRFCT